MKMNQKHMACDPKENMTMYKIGMFAQMNHVTVKALRFYESQGLFMPAYVEENGYRYYTMNQMAELHRILALKDAGFSIDDIIELNACKDETVFLQTKKNTIMRKIAELTMQLSKIEEYIQEGKNLTDSPVLIKTLPAVTCAVMTRRIGSYDELFELMPEMGKEMEERDCICALPEYCFTSYPESGYKEENILVETCEAVTEKKEDSETLQFKEFEQVEAACIFHKGSYADFHRSYEVVLRYIEVNGYQICGNIRESYIDGVWNKDSEEEWLSEIQIPVCRSKETTSDEYSI